MDVKTTPSQLFGPGHSSEIDFGRDFVNGQNTMSITMDTYTRRPNGDFITAEGRWEGQNVSNGNEATQNIFIYDIPFVRSTSRVLIIPN